MLCIVSSIVQRHVCAGINALFVRSIGICMDLIFIIMFSAGISVVRWFIEEIVWLLLFFLGGGRVSPPPRFQGGWKL